MSTQQLHRIIIERSKCCGYGLCAAICPEVYKLDEGGIVYVDSDHVADALLESAREGALACPAEAIAIQAPA